MTFLTTPSLDKKPLSSAMVGEDLTLPVGLLMHQHPHGAYADDNESMIFNRPQLTCIKTIILFLISVILMMMGVLGGYTMYRMFAPPQSNYHYHAVCDIPYNNLSSPRVYSSLFQDFDLNWGSLFDTNSNDDEFDRMASTNYFREEFDVDTSDEKSYTKINIPDFKNGRRGRSMHDFKANQSAIIDFAENRCFIMPLDYETTMPPKSLVDMLQKMSNGYYNINTEHIRRSMRVVTPPITDLTLISKSIANECFDMKIYLLEKYVSSVYKREAKILTDAGKFAEFSGKGIVEFDLVNIADIEEYEKKQN